MKFQERIIVWKTDYLKKYIECLYLKVKLTNLDFKYTKYFELLSIARSAYIETKCAYRALKSITNPT